MLEVRFPVDVIMGVPVVAVPGEIDVTNADGLRAALVRAAAYRSATVVVDMTRTQYCDSYALHVLVDAHKRAVAGGGEMLVALSSAIVLRVLEITGIGRVIPNFTSLDEALAQAVAGIR
jgi:anti-sigma B factor antagonist